MIARVTSFDSGKKHGMNRSGSSVPRRVVGALEWGAREVGHDRPDFDGTVEEDAAGFASASGREFLPDRLGIVITEHGPDGGRRGPLADEL